MSTLGESFRERTSSYDFQTQFETVFQVILIGVIAICVFIPFGILLLQAFVDGELVHEFVIEISFINFQETLAEPAFKDVILNTALFSLGTVVLAHILGFIFAYILTRMNIPYQSMFHTLMFLPIFVSPLVLALGYSFAFTRGGFYYQLMEKFMDPISITNVWGMIAIGSLWLTPFAYSFISAGLQNIDPEMEAAGRLTGASEATVLREISLPLLKPFLLSSLFLTVLLSLQAISVPAILGLPDRTYILATYILGLEGRTVPPPYSKMAAVGVIMIVISIIIVFGIRRLIGDVSEYTVITGRGRGRNIYTSPTKQAIAVTILGIYIIAFLFVPFLQVMSVGFTTPGSVVPFQFADLSPMWFEEVFDRKSFKLAVKNTVTIAAVTASAAVVLTGIMSYITNRVEGYTSKALDMITWVPIATPGIVLGLAYLWSVLIFDVGLYGTIFVLMLAFFIRFSSLGMRMNTSLIAQQAAELDEQAKICGAALFSRLRNVIFPNAKNGMMSIWVILFTLFMNELSTSIFLYTSSSRVITVTVFELWQTAQYGALGALATIQVFITLTVISTMIVLFDVDIQAV